MFMHNFKYSLKTLFRNKALIFWTFAFPLILGTFFNMAFKNIESSEKLDTINIAIINSIEFNNNEIFKTAFESLSDESNPDCLFKIEYTTEEEAIALIEEKSIVGYLKLVEGEPKLTFSTNGIDQTIFKYVTEEITETSAIIKTLSESEIKEYFSSGNYSPDYNKIYNNIVSLLKEDNIKINNISNKNLSYTMIEFYTLIAMACLYGGILGAIAINQNLANMSSQGKRVAVSPIKKASIILSSALASYVTQIIGIALLFLYTIFALHVDFGSNLTLIILLALVGCLAGLSLGTFVATTIKSNDNVKTGIIIALTMSGCFLSGMMGITMKYIIDKNIPILNKINPANMITDGFYSLYYYETLDRYIFNIISLLLFSGLLLIISYISLRGKKYDSI